MLTRGDGAAWRVDVHCNRLVGGVGLKPQQLSNNRSGHVVVDLAIQTDNSLLKVELALMLSGASDRGAFVPAGVWKRYPLR